MEIHSLPVISTNHLTQEVSDTLTKDGNNNPWCACASWENGFFLHLDDLEAAVCEGDSTPQCLFDIRDWLRAKNLVCTHGDHKFRGDWVRLDRDADPVDDLPTYDW